MDNIEKPGAATEHPLAGKGLPIKQWLVVIFLPITVLLAVWLGLGFIGILLDRAEAVAVVIGSLSLAVSAYAALKSAHLARLNWERRRMGARALLRSDVRDIAYALCERDPSELAEESWDGEIHRLEALEARLSKKIDQIGLIAADFSEAEFLRVHDFYLGGYQVFFGVRRLRLSRHDHAGVRAAALSTLQQDLSRLLEEGRNSIREKVGSLPIDGCVTEFESWLRARQEPMES